MSGGLAAAAWLAAATLASEDLACVSAGLLARAGRVGLVEGMAGCAAGIAAGDLALWGIGRLLGHRLRSWRWAARRLQGAGPGMGRHLGAAILASRFVPGSRVAFFLLAGMTCQPALPVAGWTLLAASLWTPLLVGGAALMGEAFAGWFKGASLAALSAAAACLLALGLARAASRRRARSDSRRRVGARLLAAATRLRRWEYWPAGIIYMPLVPWLALLALRHRGFGTLAAANPGIPGGGFAGESKGAILSALPAEAVLDFDVLSRGVPADRLARLLGWMRARGGCWPIVLKPDAGQRGTGVRVIRDEAQALAYLREHTAPVLAQAHHPGPYEAGIFYVRMPGEARGRVTSITDKIFPVVTGDGRSTLEDLVWDHPRHRAQAGVFLRRLGEKASRIPEHGETVRLAEAGNHCQGTMFLDGERLATPELEAAIDGIARRFPGFFFGRFDVRYARVDDLRRGTGFAIVELNGVTSESTHIYDPSYSLWSAWVTLGRQWATAFRIGHENRKRGAAGSSAPRLLGAALRHRRHPSAGTLAD